MTSNQTVRLPERLATTLAHAGPTAAAWGDRLPTLVADLAAEWALTIGLPYDGGSWSLVLAAERRSEPCVLRLVLPDQYGRDQIAVLQAADGRGVVRLLEVDPERGAMLLERLHPAPARSWDTMPALIATALRAFWPATAHLVRKPSQHPHKAAGLIALIDDLAPLAEPRHRPVVERARHLAEERLAAHDPSRAVFCHGDPHDGNLMTRANGEPVLIDADGIGGCEPEYDLGVILRSWTDVVLPSHDPRRLLVDKATELASLTGTDPGAILAWSDIERVTTGLYLRHLGHDEDGLLHLDSALHLLTHA